MNITFRNRALEKLANSGKELARKFGVQVARKIAIRLGTLDATDCLANVKHSPPERRHELKGQRKGQFAVDTTKTSGVRVIFKPNHDPVPTKEDGGVDLSQVTDIVIWDIDDYHE